MAKQTINGDIELNGAVLGSAENIVFYSKEQTLTDVQKEQARENIGAAAESDIPEPQAAVLYTLQSLTDQ